MTRHVTDPEEALQRAILSVNKMLWLKVPGMMSQASDWAEWLAKKGGKYTMSGAGLAEGVASATVHITAMVGGASGAFATGLGAVASVAGPVAIPLTVVNAAYHAKAVYSTAWHVTALKALRKHASQNRSNLRMWRSSDATLGALDYAINQKTEKAVRRSASAVPGLGVIGTIYTFGRMVHKIRKGTKGKARGEKATILVDQMIDRGDFLATAIVIELLGWDDFVYVAGLHHQNLKPKLAAAVAEKLRST
jgi:hypothetical protein